MPKLKTHSGAKKRFNLTKSGKVKRARAYKSHILTKKDTKRTPIDGLLWGWHILYSVIQFNILLK